MKGGQIKLFLLSGGLELYYEGEYWRPSTTLLTGWLESNWKDGHNSWQ